MGDVQVIDKPSGGTYSVPAPREFPSSERHARGTWLPGLRRRRVLLHAGASGRCGRRRRRQGVAAAVPGSQAGAGRDVRVHGGRVRRGQGWRRRGKAFLAHLRSRMRRVVRGHDKPYAIFEPFGARPNGSFDETEEFVLDNIAKVATGQRDAGCHFDLYSVDFWVDYRGTLKECDPVAVSQRAESNTSRTRQAGDSTRALDRRFDGGLVDRRQSESGRSGLSELRSSRSPIR